MPTSGFYRLMGSIKQRVKNLVGKPREATEREADTVLGPNRDAAKLQRENELRKFLRKR